MGLDEICAGDKLAVAASTDVISVQTIPTTNWVILTVPLNAPNPAPAVPIHRQSLIAAHCIYGVLQRQCSGICHMEWHDIIISTA